MALKEYKPGTTFPGRMGRTIGESSPAWPAPLRAKEGAPNVLFIKDKKLHYIHNYVGAEEFHVESKEEVPEGKAELRFEFELAGQPDLAKGKGAPGRAQLYINRKLVGQTDFPVTVPLAVGIGGGLSVGRNPGAPVSRLYHPPFAFTGEIIKVTADVSGKMIQDTEEERKAQAKAMMARQ
jgi:arylsulfatase